MPDLRNLCSRWEDAEVLCNEPESDDIVLLGLSSEAKEQEEQKRTDNGKPYSKLHRHDSRRVASPFDSWRLANIPEVKVSVCP